MWLKRKSSQGLVLFSVLTVSISQIANAQTGLYALTDLGTIEASTVCPCFFGVAINDSGSAAGRFYAPDGEFHAFRWDSGEMSDLGTLGGPASQALGMNDAGAVVGYSDSASDGQHAFLYSSGEMFSLGTLGGPNSSARDINELNQVVGTAQPSNPEYGHAFLWEGDSMTDLGTLGGPFSDAHGINDLGDVAGSSWDEDWDIHAVWWPAGADQIIALPGLSEGHSGVRDVNNQRQMVGSSWTGENNGASNIFHAVLWQDGQAFDLGLLAEAGAGISAYGAPSHTSTSAAAINELSVIVGNSFPIDIGPPLRPGPWIYENGQMTNLNDLLVDSDASWILYEVREINDAGQIIGYGRFGEEGSFHAVRLDPVVSAPADLNGDGFVDTVDLLALLATWGPCDDCAADLTGDGLVGIEDLLILLEAWG